MAQYGRARETLTKVDEVLVRTTARGLLYVPAGHFPFAHSQSKAAGRRI